MLRWITYHLSSCEDSRCQGKSWTLWPAWLWPLSWFELGSDRCSQPVPLGSPPERRQRTSWHTVPMLDTKNKTNKNPQIKMDEITKKNNMLNCKLDSVHLTLSAASLTARAQAISEAPPPYTTRLSLTRLRITQSASWRARFASSTI